MSLYKLFWLMATPSVCLQGVQSVEFQKFLHSNCLLGQLASPVAVFLTSPEGSLVDKCVWASWGKGFLEGGKCNDPYFILTRYAIRVGTHYTDSQLRGMLLITSIVHVRQSTYFLYLFLFIFPFIQIYYLRCSFRYSSLLNNRYLISLQFAQVAYFTTISSMPHAYSHVARSPDF